jgi:polysaccharide export outer membrane protein
MRHKLIVRYFKLLVRMWLFVLVIGSLVPVAVASAQQRGSAPPVAGTYQIGPEDVLQISVWKEETLQREVLVRPDGWISFPLVGDVRAAGRTTKELTNEIRVRLTRYIPDPVVTVTVKTIAGNKIFVIGRVNKPGEYVIGRYVDVLQALALAGGLTPFAVEKKIKIVRKQGDKEIIFPFNYAEVKKGNELKQNIILQGGDVVVVP